MASGIIVIDKPADWTSHDVVAKLRGCLKEKRIGHAGTLDPMATGVLPIFVGRATRAVEFAAEGDKEYIAGLRLGLVTDTQDTTGTTREEKPVCVSDAQFEAALVPFRGDILQLPPMFSAIKRQGKKLYELARAGKEVERALRPITIFDLVLMDRVSETDFILRIRCSKGSYVRTICHDIGAALGTGGCMFSLRRSMAAGFTQDEAIALSAVLAAESPASLLRPVDAYFEKHPAISVDEEAEKKIRNGVSPSFEGTDGTYRVYGGDQAFLMLGQLENQTLQCIKSFFEVSI